MGRCNSCFAVVKKNDRVCYICGDPVPRYASMVAKRKRVTAFTNALFIASIGFSIYSFFSEQKLSLAVSISISAGLIILRIIADKLAKQSDPVAR